MVIRTVTITGADNKTNQRDLATLSKKFPFVEWGILISKNSEGLSRFPSHYWIKKLFTYNLNLSCHVCGTLVRSLLKGSLELNLELLDSFNRIQLNFHVENVKVDIDSFSQLLKDIGKDIIFQMDGKNDYLMFKLYDKFARIFPLFDLSGGAGIVPNEWHFPLKYNNSTELIYCGYAGGLGPDNLEDQLRRIENVVGDHTIWIDMETKVRSKNDSVFDIDRVETCLEIAKPYVKEIL